MPVKKLEKLSFLKSKGTVNSDILAQYVRVYRSNQRQGTVKVKTRSEVRGGGAKPFRQKGTGRARAGSSSSPLWRGGGVVHGPTPRDWTKNLSKKMKDNALKNVILLKLKDGAIIEDDLSAVFKKIRTKNAAKYMSDNKIEGRFLIITKELNDIVYKSFRNIRYVVVKPVSEVSIYDLLLAKTILFDSGVSNYYEERYK